MGIRKKKNSVNDVVDCTVSEFLMDRNRLTLDIGSCGLGDLIVIRMLASHIAQSCPGVRIDLVSNDRVVDVARSLPPHPDIDGIATTPENTSFVVRIRPAAMYEDDGDPRSRLRIWSTYIDATLDTDNISHLNGTHRAHMPEWVGGGKPVFFTSATANDRSLPSAEVAKILPFLPADTVVVSEPLESIAVLLEVIKHASHVYTVDSGPLHVAGSMGAPTTAISFFKPANYFEELYPTVAVVQARYDDGCPCGSRRSCVYEGHNDEGHLPCNYTVDPQAVINAKRDGKKTCYVAVPSGIGDALWSMVKVPEIRKVYDRVVVCVQKTGTPRCADFLRRFDFIDDVVYVDFPIHPKMTKNGKTVTTDEDGRYVYVQSSKGYCGFDWVLISNGELERGVKLDEWLPEVQTDWTIGQNFSYRDEDKSLTDVPPGRFAVFYPGPLRGNTEDGHNRGGIWSPEEWVELHAFVENAGIDVVYVGAEYDMAYMNDLLAPALLARGVTKKYDFIGKLSIGSTFWLTEKCEFVLSYQAGIGIFPLYRGVKSAIWWRQDGDSISPSIKLCFDERMNGGWVPPQYRKNHMPLYYGVDDAATVMGKLSRAGWV